MSQEAKKSKLDPDTKESKNGSAVKDKKNGDVEEPASKKQKTSDKGDGKKISKS